MVDARDPEDRGKLTSVHVQGSRLTHSARASEMHQTCGEGSDERFSKLSTRCPGTHYRVVRMEKDGLVL